MTVKITYGRPHDQEFNINGSRVTISTFKINTKSLVMCENTDDDVEFVVIQYTDENCRIVAPDLVDVKDPDLVFMYFTSGFTGTAVVVAGGVDSIEKVNTSVICAEPLVKGPEKIWVDPYKRRRYV